jgi:hypothetical protein
MFVPKKLEETVKQNQEAEEQQLSTSEPGPHSPPPAALPEYHETNFQHFLRIK